MDYIQVEIQTSKTEIRGILIALLSESDYEGFEEQEQALKAFIPESAFCLETLQNILDPLDLNFKTEKIIKTNWNKAWEENFPPVVVEGFCTVLADFHKINADTPYKIFITPKMSFGTGHHATTKLMMKTMQEMDFKDKTVFDFGTGTGILAVLAEKLGAKEVLAVDNDEWSYENASENVQKNNTENIRVALGSMDDVEDRVFDVVLANINRHILLKYMELLWKKTGEKGKIVMSGLLSEDREVILEAAQNQGFKLKDEKEENHWKAFLFLKP